MDCRITSIKARWERRAKRPGESGLTLIEMMVATAISSVVALGVASLIFYTGRSFAAMTNYVELDQRSRIALDTISSEIRQANRLKVYQEDKLTFEDSDGTDLTYAYDADEQTLSRIKGTETKVLLTECTYLKFSIYRRNPIGGTYDQFPAGTADTCKLVQLHWVCERRTLGDVVNTESVQSAKVVIRKQ